MSDSKDFRPKKLLCVVAHADDIEFCCGGSIAKWSAEGTEVHYLVCSDGANGNADRGKSNQEVAATRAREQRQAADVLGVKSVVQLQYPDAHIEVSDDLRRDIVRVIRGVKPDTVFTIDPTLVYSAPLNYINHRDHRAVGLACFDAVYPLARDHAAFPELLDEGLEPHKVGTLLLNNYERCNLVVDISDYFERKVEAIKAHSSQMGDATNAANYMREIALDMAKDSDFELGEGFIKLTTMA